MPRMPTIAAERRAARAELRATRRDAAMTTAEQAARAERFRELGLETVRRHRRVVEIARGLREQLQAAAHSRAALVVENAALVAERNALREDLEGRDEEVALLEEQRDVAVNASARLAADRDALYVELEQERAERDADRAEWIKAEKSAASNSATAVDFMLQRDRARAEVDRLREELREQRLRADDSYRTWRSDYQAEAQAATEARLQRDVALCQVREFYAKYNGLDKETLTVRLGPNGELIIGTTGPDVN